MTSKSKPKITDALRAEAKKNPNGWIYEIDFDFLPEEHTPPEAIVGAWEVDISGNLTGVFKYNEKHQKIITASRSPRDYMNKAIAAHHAGTWVVEIDPAYDHLFPAVPEEGKIGSWLVGPDGNLTDQFRPNAKYVGDIKT